ALSMERLQALVNGPLQRIGLSATQKPIEEVARFLVGNRNAAGAVFDYSVGQVLCAGNAPAQNVRPHPGPLPQEREKRSPKQDESTQVESRDPGNTRQPGCTIIDSGHSRNLDLAIELPGSPLEAVMSNEVWAEVYNRLVDLIEQHQTTLVFVNTRRLAE